LINTLVWTPPKHRSYALRLFEKAVISLRRGDAEQMARHPGEEMIFGCSIQFPETEELGAAVIGEDEGGLIEAFKAAKQRT
jgi:hypothetical protein